MIAFLRQLVLVAVSAAVSWWLLFGAELPPAPLAAAPEPAAPRPLSVAVMPEPVNAAQPAPARTTEPDVDVVEDAPPPPELGDPAGEDDAALANAAAEEPAAVEPETEPRPEEAPAASADDATDDGDDDVAEAEPVPDRPTTESLMRDPELTAIAEAELSGARRGFATALVAAPEDQLDIARYFGEEIVLVPRDVLDPSRTEVRYFRLDLTGETPRVETVRGRPALERFRQYRDLFDYEYTRLSEPLRELRRSVLTRSEVYLFAALLPVSEWAVVVGRRREALVASGRDAEDVRRFVLRYERRPSNGFEVTVDSIVFSDGTRFVPSASN